VMTKGDLALQSVADRLERLVRRTHSAPPAAAPSGPQLDGRRSRRLKRGAYPLLVVGGAFAAGYLAAKVIDWRSHAHPR